MKLVSSFLILLVVALTWGLRQDRSGDADKNYLTAVVTVINTSSLQRVDQLLKINLSDFKTRHPDFNEYNFFITYRGKEIASQVADSNLDGKAGRILIASSFGPNETKKFIIRYYPTGRKFRNYPLQTQAQLGMKVDYDKVGGYYTRGEFRTVDSTTVPADHFAHDALYRIEGPGWELKWIVYRFYLDSRNRTDIFGKTTGDMVLQRIGVNDLVSDSKESYSRMLDWGMDIFKVGESLGIGSVAMWNDSGAVTVSNVSRVRCFIREDGPIRSAVRTEYSDWHVGSKSYELTTVYSISAGSRLTNVALSLHGKDAEMCTGLARHADCIFTTSSGDTGKQWSYIALYGKQSLAGDNLGTAIFYKQADVIRLTGDSLSHIVVLRASGGNLEYYFGAAWEKEPGGIKDIRTFRAFLENERAILGKPVEIRY
ncbi:MAG TPA: DUF4861 family protein [Candidatus Kryptonia bacterium]